MPCLHCKGDMEASTTLHVVEIDNRIIIVKNVPCMKCTQCGETVYTGSTVKRLEQIIDSVKNVFTEVAIVNYPEKAA